MNTNETKWIHGRFICGDGHSLPLNCTHPDTQKMVEVADGALAQVLALHPQIVDGLDKLGEGFLGDVRVEFYGKVHRFGRSSVKRSSAGSKSKTTKTKPYHYDLLQRTQGREHCR